MRVFSVGPEGGFTEYRQVPFEADHAESDLEQWLESNPDGILEAGELLIIGRQVPTERGKSIDLLGVDQRGNVVVVELKRGRTPREVIAQALEYAAFAARLDAAALEDIHREYSQDHLEMDLAYSHGEYFGLEARTVAFNKDQRIVIVGQQMPQEIRQVARFLGDKGILVTCVEFTFFQDPGVGRLLSQEIVVGAEHARPQQAARPRVTRAEFLESCDDNGKAVYTRIFDLADRQTINGPQTVRWGPKGFTMGVDVDGTRVIFCYAYSPGSAYKQTLYTALLDKRGFRKMQAPEAVEQLHEEAKRTGLFAPAGRELKCLIDRAFTDAEMDSLVTWCESVAQAIREHAGPGGPPPG
ncbi:MAG: hypothetical protein OXR64_05260 [Chloroflexota bacterium]|nr:hypothetical protein [Chloroflexota bacterium]